MRKLNKKNVLLACLSLSLVAGTAGAFAINNQTASANTTTLAMENGASLYLGGETTGLKFSFTDSAYDENADYGMLIVANDMLEAAQTALANSEITGVDADDYVNLLAKAQEKGVFNVNDKYINVAVAPNADGVFSHSVGNLNGFNYVREFIGIGYKVTGANTYDYATFNNNVRSVFEVANLALNANVYDGGDLDGNGELDAEERAEKAKIDEHKASIQNYVTTGFKFVYGEDAVPTFSKSNTYVGADLVPTLTNVKEKEIDIAMHWYCDTDSLVRGKNQTVEPKLAGVYETTATVNVLKDAEELSVYKNLTSEGRADTDFFATVDAPVVEGTYTAKLAGGYYKATDVKSKENVTGYLAFKNPDAEDGKYTLEAGKGYSLDFYFKGNNMPNVEFFANEISSTIYKAYGSGRVGYLVTNGLVTEYLYQRYNALAQVGLTTTFDSTKQALWTDWKAVDTTACTIGKSNHKWNGISNYSTSFYQYGVTAYDGYTEVLSDGKKKATLTFAAYDNQKGETRTWYYSSSSTLTNQASNKIERSDFSMESLMADESKQWHYVVGMYMDASNNVKIESFLYEITSEGETLKASFNKTVETTTEVRSGYIVAHGALKGRSGSTSESAYIPSEFAYTTPKQITR